MGVRGTRVALTTGMTRGTCRVCRAEFALNLRTGKLAGHGKSAASPRGCAGAGEPPMSRRELRQSAEVTDLHPPVEPDPEPEPGGDDIDVPVFRQGAIPDVGVTMKPPPPHAC